MIGRRQFTIALGASLAAPFVLRHSAQAQQLRVRRDVMDMPDDDPFFAKYAQAVEAMHAEAATLGRNWIVQAKIHADRAEHGGIEFLYWHRHQVALFERMCSELIGDTDFALPYWNWTKRSGQLPNPLFDLDALNVEFWNDPGVYNGAMWGGIDTVGRRGLVRGQGLQDDPVRGGAFTQATVDSIRNETDAGIFQSRLQGTPHNTAHVVTGATATGKTGHIGSGLSPLDPIFWLHHCMVDRVWAEWQALGNQTPDPGSAYNGFFFDGSGNPVDVDTTGAMQTASLGYTYDNLLQPVPAPAPIEDDLFSMFSEAQLIEGLARSAPAVIAAAENDQTTVPEVETAIPVTVASLADELQRSRVFLQSQATSRTGFGVEGRRLLAKFSAVAPPEGRTDILVNVFINCPYLSPTTEYTDPYYAGTFSFFATMPNMKQRQEFAVDITKPVRKLFEEGRIRGNELTVQLMTVGARPGAVPETSFRAGSLKIVSA